MHRELEWPVSKATCLYTNLYMVYIYLYKIKKALAEKSLCRDACGNSALSQQAFFTATKVTCNFGVVEDWAGAWRRKRRNRMYIYEVLACSLGVASPNFRIGAGELSRLRSTMDVN